MLFFCCHKCHRQCKFGWKNELFSRQRGREKKPFSVSSSLNVLLLNHAFVKTYLNKNCIKLKYNGLLHPLWHLWQQKCKNSWQERARTRARKGVYRYFHNSNVPFPISISERRISRLLPLYWKRHVSFNKTTRRYQQNNTSFPTKQHVVSNETTQCFRQNKPWVVRKRHALSDNTLFGQCPTSGGEQKNSKKQNTLDLTSQNCQNQG